MTSLNDGLWSGSIIEIIPFLPQIYILRIFMSLCTLSLNKTDLFKHSQMESYVYFKKIEKYMCTLECIVCTYLYVSLPISI